MESLSAHETPIGGPNTSDRPELPPGPSRDRDVIFLAVILIGAFMAVLDAFVVNVAIPSIRADLGATQPEIELVVAGYFLTYACLMITGGRLGDIYDRKRIFLVGMALFTGASATCGFAPGASVLIVSRLAQGFGAALMYPQILSMLQVRFVGARRAAALGAYAAVIGCASVAGQLIGGALIQLDLAGLSWRAVFLVNVPIGIVGLLVGYRVLEGSKAEPRPGMDYPGVILVGGALACVIVGLTEGPNVGWAPWTWELLCAAPVLLLAFVVVEVRASALGGSPIVSPGLFAQRSFSLGILIGILFFTGLGGLFFTLAIFLQSGLGLSPFFAGLTFVPLGLGFILAALLSPRYTLRWGKYVLVLGYGMASAGALSALAILSSLGGSVAAYELVPSLFLIGCGNGFGMSTLVGTILARVRRPDVGPASGVLATVMQMGQGFGVALVGLVFYASLGPSVSAVIPSLTNYVHAFSTTTKVVAALDGVSMLLAVALPSAGGETSDLLLGNEPRRLSRLAYPFYFVTGGRIGRPLVQHILEDVGVRRNAAIDEAPEDFGEFLVHHYRRSVGDSDFFQFLTREALGDAEEVLPLDKIRSQVIERSVQEIRDRQSRGSIRSDLDPECLRLMAFALVTYPRVYHKIAHHILGLGPNDPEFDVRWTEFLEKLGGVLSESSSSRKPPTP